MSRRAGRGRRAATVKGARARRTARYGRPGGRSHSPVRRGPTAPRWRAAGDRLRPAAALGAWAGARRAGGPAWLWRGQRGASFVEYALLLAVIAVGTAGVLALLQGTLVGVFTNVRDTLLPYAGAGP
jgi:Flp pilus assembly pilin Flp